MPAWSRARLRFGGEFLVARRVHFGGGGTGLRAGKIQLARRNAQVADGLIAFVIRLGLFRFALAAATTLAFSCSTLAWSAVNCALACSQAALGGGQFGPRLIQPRLIIARINLQQHVAWL